MALAFYLCLFFAVVVLPLLSFLRNGAILRGGAVAAAQGKRKGAESSSEIALRAAAAGPPPPPPPTTSPASRGAEAPLVLDAPLPRSATNGGSFTFGGDPASPHSQSSEVFLRPRRRAELQRRQQKQLAAAGDGSAPVTEVPPTSDVAAAWDQSQLSSDDHIRLIFLFTTAVPTLAFWYWNLRTVEPRALLWVYRHFRGISASAGIDETDQTFLRVSLAALTLGFGGAALLWYAGFVYLNHRDKDVSLKRHNRTCLDRAVNWFKFRVYRRYVNFQCRLWKRYFSLQLVPAYGPLPLFVFPQHPCGEGGGESGNEAAADKTRSTTRAVGVASAARHNPFFMAASADDTLPSPSDMPLHLPVMPMLEGARSPERAASSSGKDGSGSTAMAPHDSGSVIPGCAFEVGGIPRTPTRPRGRSGSGGADTSGTKTDDGSGDDWDDEERGQVRRRHTGATTQPPSAHRGGSAEAAPATRQPSISFTSSELFQNAEAAPTAADPPPKPPPMRRAHYFFAAHPHGILPWCCCVNMISNVTRRDEKLFLDNRDLVLHPSEALNASSTPPPPQPVPPRVTSAFTTSNTRATSPTDGLPLGASRTFAPLTLGGSGGGDGRGSATAATSEGVGATDGGAAYAKARYYAYDTVFKKFVLRLDKDEALPTSSADAEVYRRRLRTAAAKREAAAAARRAARTPQPPIDAAIATTATSGSSSTSTSAAAAEPPKQPSLRRRLKIRIRAVVATFPFYVPIMREVYMFHGYMDASYETCKRVLLYNNSTQREREGLPPAKAAASPSQAAVSESSSEDSEDESTLPDDLNHLLLFPGGASEALLSSAEGPARLLLRRRKGFLRLAIHTQSGLVPVYTFGETDYFEQYATAETRHTTAVDDDEDSTYISRRESAADTPLSPTAAAVAGPALQRSPREKVLMARRGSTSTDRTTATPLGSPTVVSAPELPVGGCASPLSSPTMSPVSPSPCHVPASARADHQRAETRKEREQRLLREDCAARERGGRTPAPAHTQPLSLAKRRGCGEAVDVNEPARLGALEHGATTLEVPTRLAQRHAAKTAATTAPRADSRFARFIKAVPRLFQETFGLSLPVVKNVIPHRVTGATVVGRPIYFELPADLQRMYTDPANYFDKEKERDVLRAAQEVYFRELQELFLKYAPVYLKDPSRRRLEII